MNMILQGPPFNLQGSRGTSKRNSNEIDFKQRLCLLSAVSREKHKDPINGQIVKL